jgi:hypothetical protein
MNDNDLYGDIDDAKVYDALRRGDVEGAADEICYSYTGRDGGEADTDGIFKDIVSSLNYMLRNSNPTGIHPEAEASSTEIKDDSMLPSGVKDEGNEFTGDLARTQKGGKFKIGGKTVINTTGQIAEKICPKCGKELCECDTMEESKMKMKDESGLQAYIGKKKYGAADFKALQKAGREHDMKKKEQIKAKHSHHRS